MNVRIISTPKRSQAANVDVCAIAACKFPWYPGTVTLWKKTEKNDRKD